MNILASKYWMVLYFFCIGLLPVLTGQSAIQGTIDTSATYLVNNVFLAGECFSTDSASIYGEYGQIGTFSNGIDAIGIQSGIVLSSGNVTDISGPNDDFFTTTQYDIINNDPDLSQLANGQNLRDVAILEFDFTPTVDSASFEYVFASEEYCTFAGAGWNDIFGFFVSGPGLNGPFTNGAVNIAVIPGSAQELSINTVNHFINSSLYNNNIPLSAPIPCNTTEGVAVDVFEFNGFTDIFTASVDVIPCETYHIKMIIADRGDPIYDSAVFLKAGSFTAGLTATVQGEITGDSFSNTEPLEGCGSTSFIFSRADTFIQNDLIVHFELLAGNTATPGVDYAVLPDSVIIPAGVFSDTLHIDIFPDGIIEGPESLGIRLRNPCTCTEAEFTITIHDPPPLTAAVSDDIEICLGASAEVVALPEGGFGALSYQWETGGTDSVQLTSPPQTGDYLLTVTDACNQEATASYHADVYQANAEIIGGGVICDGVNEAVIGVVLNEGSSYNFDVTSPTQTQSFSNILADTFWLSVTEVGNYSLNNLVADNCPGLMQGVALISSGDFTTNNQVDSVSCFGLSDGQISVTPQGAISPYTYVWADDVSTDSIASTLIAGNYALTVTDGNGCQRSSMFNIGQPLLLEAVIDSIQIETTCLDAGALGILPNGGISPYIFMWSNNEQTAQVSNLEADDYSVTITDTRNCTTTQNATITSNDLPPTAIIAMPDTLSCVAEMVSLDASDSSQNGPFDYEWLNPDGLPVFPPNPLLWEATAAGEYFLTVTNTENGCSSDTSVIIAGNFELANILISPVDDSLDCNTTSLNLHVDPAMPSNANWTWADDLGAPIGLQNDAEITVTTGGWYYLNSIHQTSGCTRSDSVLVEADAISLMGEIVSSNDLNCIDETATLSAQISNSQGPFLYDWEANDGGIINGSNTTESIEAISAGTYAVTVTDESNGCMMILNNMLIDQSNIVEINAIPDTILNCYHPTITLTGSSFSVTPLDYEWFNEQGQSINNQSFINISTDGQYEIFATDPMTGCQDSLLINVAEDFMPPAISLNNISTITCLDSLANINLSDSAAHWQVTWLDNLGDIILEDEYSIEIAQAGDYSVDLLDTLNGCTNMQAFEILSNQIPPSANIVVPDTIGCAPNTVNLTLENLNGSGNYSFTWTGPVNGFSGPTDQINATATTSGIYQITINDLSNGCQVIPETEVFSEMAEPQIVLQAIDTIDCFNDNIIVNANDLGDLFEPIWQDQDGNTLLENVWSFQASNAGQFILQVTNLENSCLSNLPFEIHENSVFPSAEIVVSDTINCIQSTSSISLQNIIGSGNYDYNWSGPINGVSGAGENITALLSGIFSVEITDLDNGCSANLTTEVISDFTAPSIILSDIPDINCTENTALVNVSNPSLEWQAAWQDDLGNVLLSNQWMYEATAAGNYQLISLNNETGCSDTIPFTVIADLNPPDAALTLPELLTCNQPSTAISVEDLSGTGVYNYSWEGPANSIIGTNMQDEVMVQEPGEHFVTVTDQFNGCSDTLNTIVLADQVYPEITVADSTLINCSDPLSMVEASYSAGIPVDFFWKNEDDSFLQTGAILMVETAGNYVFVVENTDNGCQSEATVVVEGDFENPQFELDVIPQITCQDSVIQISINEVNTWTPMWLNAAGDTLSTGSWFLDVNTAGNYNLLVVDELNGCQTTAPAVVLENTVAPTIDIQAQGFLDCFSGEYDLDLGNSSTGNIFSYQVFDADGTVIYTGVSPDITLENSGDFVFEIQNTTTGCLHETPFNVTSNHPSIEGIDVQNSACANQSGRIIFEQITGGIPPYIYSIDGGQQFYSSSQFSLLPQGNYQLIVQDAGGCLDEAEAIITDNAPPTVNLPAQLEIALGESVTLPTQVLGLSAPIAQIEWSNSAFLDCPDCLQPNASPTETQSFEINILDENGCTARAYTIVVVDQRVPIYIPNAFSPGFNDGNNDVFMVFAEIGVVSEITSIDIFDRWGNQVYANTNLTANSPAGCWDGKFQGKALNPGVYVYQVRLLLMSGQEEFFTGEVILMN